MKKLVLAALLATFAAGASAADKISFGVSATYPPFESLDASNKIVGFDIDLATALCKQMQAECTFTNHAFDSLIPAIYLVITLVSQYILKRIDLRATRFERRPG